MGLDMHLYGRKFLGFGADKRMEDGFEVLFIDLKIGYWRKRWNLHNWIIGNVAHGKDECQEIALSTDDLRNLAVAITNKALPKSEDDEGHDGDESLEDLDIIASALQWLTAEGKDGWRSIVYRASW